LTGKLEGEKEMRAAQRILMVCLICLPAAAFADVYPLNPPPDVSIFFISGNGGDYSGLAAGITDYGNCVSGCGPPLSFSQSGGTFDITTIEDSTQVYLAGNLISSVVGSGNTANELGELFQVTTDNTALWEAIEGQLPSSFGSEVVIDFNNTNEEYFAADLTPAVPEPASLTLLLCGLAAGYARKRWAGKKS
jgi:hypothetical protein